jgi:uncharacterized protein YndB with AHSA1/START domain
MDTPSEDQFVISRTVNVPRDLVWKAWTEPERMAKWWGPKGFTMLKATLDLRPGRLFHYGMQSPDGFEMWGKFVFREVAPKDRLSFVVSFSDKDGGTTRHFAHQTWPLEMLTTVTFTEQDGKTTLTLTGGAVNATAEECQTYKDGHASMRQGFGGTFDQLDEYLATAN